MSASLKSSGCNRHTPYDDVAREAVRLGPKGLAVVSCLGNKQPATPKEDNGAGGFKYASRDPSVILDLWRRYPGPLIGVRTGAASNIVVLDLDLQHPTADQWFDEHCTRLQDHRMHRTRSGGLHILFQAQEGITNRPPRNEKGEKTVGVDMRGEGGYIIWWPATGLEVINDVRPKPVPAWLVEMVMPPPPPVADLQKIENGLRNADRYVQAAVRGAVAKVASAPEGRRNDTLNAETYSLARFISGGHLTAGQIAEAMAAAGLQAGLTKPEIEKTIASALRARMAG